MSSEQLIMSALKFSRSPYLDNTFIVAFDINGTGML